MGLLKEAGKFPMEAYMKACGLKKTRKSKKLGINEMAFNAYETAKSKGFHKPSNLTVEQRVLCRLALVHSEVSEGNYILDFLLWNT